MGERAQKLRLAFEEELPDIAFDDAVVEHLASDPDDWLQASEDAVADAWSPFLLSHCAASDEEGAREVCQRLLARLRPAAEIQGLKEWMERLRLPLGRYAASAQTWCHREGITTVGGIMDRAQDFCDAIQLKTLERKRVLDCVAARAAPSGAAQAPVVHRKAETDSHHPTFGTPDKTYSILEELGSGACARVHRCVRRGAEQQPDEVFAVKIIGLSRLQMQQDASRAKEKLRRETENLFALRHPNIVALHDSFETERDLYLVMELVEGGELYHHIVESRFRRLGDQAAGYVFTQLADALIYIHGRQIVHRDLKPENILVHRGESRPDEGKLVVKISDFGHSKIIGEGYSIAQTRCGTPQYWAPEVAEPKAMGYNTKVDLWSLGVVLYVMLEGTYPFDDGSSCARVSDQVREAKYRPLQHASASAGEIIRGLIQKQPQDRMSLDKCLKHQWLLKMNPFPWDTTRKFSQSDDEQFPLQVTPTEAESKKLRQELLSFNARYKLFPAVLRARKEVIWSVPSERPPGSKEEARAELLRILAPFCPPGAASGGAGRGVAVGAPLATVTEEHIRKGRPAANGRAA